MQKTIKFVDSFKFYILIPVVIFIVGIIINIFSGIDLSIDFKGGTKIAYSYTEAVDFDKVASSVKKSLVENGNITKLSYSYTDTLEAEAVTTALADTVKDFSLEATVTTIDEKSVLYVTATGQKELSQKNIDAITKKLNSTYASNKIAYTDKTNTIFESPKINTSESTDYTTGTKSVVISIVGESISTAQLNAIDTSLKAEFPNSELNRTELNSVNASVGSSFFAKSLVAILIASLLVIIYVGIRFKKVGGVSAAITALIALIHDLLFVYFVDVIFGITIDDKFMAVILTILGYSLNDTIVIYDRIRENTVLYNGTKSIREVVNISISQSLKRSLVTSITTFVAISCVTVFALFANLTSILTFSIPMSFGCIAGTFSSICIAGPIYVFWKEHREKKVVSVVNTETGEVEKKAVNYTNKVNPKKAKKKKFKY